MVLKFKTKTPLFHVQKLCKEGIIYLLTSLCPYILRLYNLTVIEYSNRVQQNLQMVI